MNKFIISLTLLVSDFLLACPNCAGADNAKDKYTVFVLGIFILLIYIPFYILFRMASKMDPKNVLKNKEESQ